MDAWLRPMLAEQAPDVPTGDDWIIEPKLDGWRIIIHRDRVSVKVYGGRNASDYTGKLPYIEGVVSRLPEDTVVDGELVADEGGSGGVQSIMASNGVHHPTVLSPPLTVTLFDVLRVNGQDVRALSWQERRAMLEAAQFKGPLVFTSKPVPASEQAHDGYLAQGYEGSVAKKITSKYVSGSRAPSWLKIKPQTTADAVVVGFKPGTGSRAGGVGAFEIEMLDPANAIPNGVRTRVGSGLTDQQLAEINADTGAWMGARVELAHHGLGKTGKPRHPVFLRRRDDLDVPEPEPAQPKPKPKPKKRSTRSASGLSGRPRNYGAMNNDKLIRSIRELENQAGEAYEKALNKHTGDPAHELNLARQEADGRGL